MLCETSGLNLQPVVAGDKLGYFIKAIGGGGCCAFGIGSQVHDPDGRAGNQAPLLILDYSGDGTGVGRLSEHVK